MLKPVETTGPGAVTASPCSDVVFSSGSSGEKEPPPYGQVQYVRCQNCGCDRVETYCPQCGQENTNPVLPLSHLCREAFCEITSTDAKLWVTLKTLLLHPGLLTVQFLQGKRAHYLGPFKLYLIASALYFLAFNWYGGQREFRQKFQSPLAKQEAQRGAAIGENWAKRNVPTASANHALDSVQSKARAEKRKRRIKQIPQRAMEAASWYLENQSNVSIFLIPLYGVCIALVYRRTKRLYVEHLIFTLHTESFTLLATVPFILGANLLRRHLGQFDLTSAIMWVVLAFTPYSYLAMRRVYGPEAVWKTIVKTGLVFFMHLFVALLMFTVGVVGYIVYWIVMQ